MNSPENVPPKPRHWRIVLGIIIIVLKLIQYTTVGIFELPESGTPAYRIGALVGDVIWFAIAGWLIYTGRKPAKPAKG